MSESIERVGVVGAGLMGAGIAEVAAKAGTDVTVCDINDAAVSAGRSRIETSLQRAVRSGKLDDDAAMAALGPFVESHLHPLDHPIAVIGAHEAGHQRVFV